MLFRFLCINSLLISTVVSAATSTTTFNVTASVAASCSISVTPLAFGSYVPTGTDVPSTTTVSATCTNGSAYNIGLDAGLSSGATISTRKMTSGLNTLSYQLYTDSNHTIVWGNIVGVDNTVSGTGTGSQQSVTIYGLIAGGQTSVQPGNYQDTITATINF